LLLCFALSQEELEHLYCFLTAPGLRVPLLLQWLSDSRPSLAQDARIQGLLRACLLEPGRWLRSKWLRGRQAVPCPPVRRGGGDEKAGGGRRGGGPGAVGAEEGALGAELLFSPETILQPLRKLLRRAGDACQGAGGAGAHSVVAQTLMFFVRLASELESYVLHAMHRANESQGKFAHLEAYVQSLACLDST